MDEIQADGMIVLDSVGEVDDSLVLEEIEDDVVDVLDIIPSITIAKVRKGYYSGNAPKQHTDQNNVENCEQYPGYDDSLSVIDQWFSSDTECDNSGSGQDSTCHTLSTPVANGKHPEENESATVLSTSAPQHHTLNTTAIAKQSKENGSAASPKSLSPASRHVQIDVVTTKPRGKNESETVPPRNNAANANHPEKKRIASFPIKHNDVANAKQPKERITSPISPEPHNPEQNDENDYATATKQPEETMSVASSKSLVSAPQHKQGIFAIAETPEKNKSATVPPQNNAVYAKFLEKKRSASFPIKHNDVANAKQPSERIASASSSNDPETNKQNDSAIATKQLEERESVAPPKSLCPTPRLEKSKVATAKQPTNISATSLNSLIPSPQQHKQNDATKEHGKNRSVVSLMSLPVGAKQEHNKNHVTTARQPEENKSAVLPEPLISAPPQQHKQHNTSTAKQPKKSAVKESLFPVPQQHKQNGTVTTKQPKKKKSATFSKSLVLVRQQHKQNNTISTKQPKKVALPKLHPARAPTQHKGKDAAPSLLSLPVPVPKARKRRRNRSVPPLLPYSVANPKRPRQGKPASSPSPLILGPKQLQQNPEQHERNNAVPSLLSFPFSGPKSKKPVHWLKQKRHVPQLFLEDESKRPPLNGPARFTASATRIKVQNQKRSAPSLLSLPFRIPKPQKENRQAPPLLSLAVAPNGNAKQDATVVSFKKREKYSGFCQ